MNDFPKPVYPKSVGYGANGRYPTTREHLQQHVDEQGSLDDTKVFIVNVKACLHSFNTNPRYAPLRSAFAEDVLVKYAGCVDSVWGLLESLEDDNLVEQSHLTDGIDVLLFEWNDEFCTEVGGQLVPFGVNLVRDVYGGSLLTGGRLMVSVNNPN